MLHLSPHQPESYRSARNCLRRCLNSGYAFTLAIETIDGRKLDVALSRVLDYGITGEHTDGRAFCELPWWELKTIKVEY